MANHTVSCNWKNEMIFNVSVDNQTIVVDVPNESLTHKGPSPKKLLLAGLAGCTGMDVVSILKKMHQPISFLNIVIDAQISEEHPKVYTSIKIIYEFKKSDSLDEKKVDHAIKLSQETYCGVAAMLRKGSEINLETRYL